MDRPKFTTRDIAKENELVRLAILEAEISELNHKIQIAQGQEKYWLDRQAAWKAQIAKKHEYHKLLQKDVDQALIIDIVSNNGSGSEVALSEPLRNFIRSKHLSDEWETFLKDYQRNQ